MKQKNVVTCVILSFVTCGIYGIIWFINLTDDAARLNNNNDFSGGKAFLFTLITCGIYGIYWYYKMGKELYSARVARNINGSDSSVLYLILGILGLGIVNYVLMQNEINELAVSGN